MVGGHLYDCTYENAHYAECGMVEGHLYGCTYENAHMRNLSRVWRPDSAKTIQEKTLAVGLRMTTSCDWMTRGGKISLIKNF
jgi:hypothetical protein